MVRGGWQHRCFPPLRTKKVGKLTRSQPDFGTAFARIKSILENPYHTWETGGEETNKLVTRLVFTSPLSYDRTTGFGTPEYTLPFLISRRLKGQKSENGSLVDLTPESWNQYAETVMEWSSYTSFS